MMDHSTAVGGRRDKAGSDVTAGNSVKSPSIAKAFTGNKAQSVAQQSTRFKKTRTRRG